MSDYPMGFTDGVTIRGLPLTMTNPGEVFWVNNSSVLAKRGIGGSDSNDGSYRKPFSTLDGAIGKCTANRGDIIMIMPGHAENISAIASTDFDVAGIAVVGLGSGSLTPKFSWTLAAGTIHIDAANISFYNIQFEANVADVLAGFNVDSNNLAFHHCKFTESGSTFNWIVVMNIADGVDDLVMEDCTYIGNDGLNDNLIQAAGTHDNFIIRNNYLAHYTAQTSTTEGIIEITTDANNFIIEGNKFFSASAAVDNAFVTLAGTGNTGWAVDNLIKGVDLDATAADYLGSFDCTGLGSSLNFAVSDVDANAVSFLTDEDLT